VILRFINELKKKKFNTDPLQICVTSKHIFLTTYVVNDEFYISFHCARKFDTIDFLKLGNTVKLGYNDHGYNKFMLITNKKSPIFGPK